VHRLASPRFKEAVALVGLFTSFYRRLLSEAKFEEMLLVVEAVEGKDKSQLIRSGTWSQVCAIPAAANKLI
jgi:hypothetical protein